MNPSQIQIWPLFRIFPIIFFTFSNVCLFLLLKGIFCLFYRWIIMQTMPDSYWGLFHILVFNVIILMLFMSHSRAVFSDPGIVPLAPNRIDFSDLHSKKNSGSGDDSSSTPPPDEDWTICTR
jgi:hypothetical protein